MAGLKVKTVTLLLAFGLASPAAKALCDAFCASGMGSASHHAGAPPADHGSMTENMVPQHHMSLWRGEMRAPSAELSAKKKSCAQPDPAMRAATFSSSDLLPVLAARFGLSSPVVHALNLPIAAGTNGSPPNSSPPVVTSLRI